MKRKIAKRSVDERRRVVEHKKILKVFFVIFLIYSIILMFPLAWIFINSFKDGYTEFMENPWGLPQKFMFSNYTEILKMETFNIPEMFKNTLVLCISCTTASIISTTFAAYVIAKYKFIFCKTIHFLYILPMVISIAGTTSSLYILMDSWDLVGTIRGMIIMSCGGTGMNFLLLYSLYKNVSSTYMEAAFIDGAGHYRVFFQIMLPQGIGLIGTMWVLGFIGHWNEYASAKIFLGAEFYTLATGIEKISELVEGSANDFLMNNYPAFFAAIMMMVMPIVCIFLVFQKQIMKLSLGGGIKE